MRTMKEHFTWGCISDKGVQNNMFKVIFNKILQSPQAYLIQIPLIRSQRPSFFKIDLSCWFSPIPYTEYHTKRKHNLKLICIFNKNQSGKQQSTRSFKIICPNVEKVVKHFCNLTVNNVKRSKLRCAAQVRNN